MRFLLFLIGLFVACTVTAQDADLCSNNKARSWWDVQHYRIHLRVDTANGFLDGTVEITAKVTGPIGDSLQIDLQAPLKIKAVETFGAGSTQKLEWSQSGDACFITGDIKNKVKNNILKLSVRYEGIPKIAVRAPWDGGMVLERDGNGKRWMGMACQGIGASVWFPCKDFQGDEPDSGMSLSMTYPKGLKMIANGRCLVEDKDAGKGFCYSSWQVTNPINNYDLTFYLGDYVHWSDTLIGKKGVLNLEYYVLRENIEKARKHFEVVKPMLHCFEEKIGPYPFYEDSYKLVDAPYLGMEHQSAVAYGNEYKMGYKGKDRSETGIGLLFDFIIVHESGHEWFGNSITAYDKADTWIHEGFTTYTETIFAECLLGKEKAFEYQRGKKALIKNDKPVTGNYNSCDEGSGDHYDKAAFMVHMIRVMMSDDHLFFAMLKEMNKRFYHKIVTGKEVEQFINEFSSKDFSKVFDQYLRSKDLPVLELNSEHKPLQYRWANCVPGFNMPVLIKAGKEEEWIYPSVQWRSLEKGKEELEVSKDFLVYVKAEKD